jgi:hypothetical protein
MEVKVGWLRVYVSPCNAATLSIIFLYLVVFQRFREFDSASPNFFALFACKSTSSSVLVFLIDDTHSNRYSALP